MEMAKIGILFDKDEARKRYGNSENTFSIYIGEILSHFGAPYVWITHLNQIQSEIDVLIVALANGSEKEVESIINFTTNGGTVITLSEYPGLATKLGFDEISLNEVGYATFDNFHKEQPLRFLKSNIWDKRNHFIEKSGQLISDYPKGESTTPALITHKVGKGLIDHWNVDIPSTIVGIQQGQKPVTKDGEPAPDGTANLDEGILKADDGFELDWNLDRSRTETGIPYFTYPYADLWREVFFHYLLKRIIDKKLTLPFIGYWPEGTKHIATISHDSDINIDESARITLQSLKDAGVRSTWCMIEPGYSKEIYEKVKTADHELAFHYNALEKENGNWSEAEFNRQLKWLKGATELEEIHSNKNHYTRFQGWGDLFEWCERAGIQLDQSRGPSKKGNIGFLFGTAHPYFPVASYQDQNRLYDVLELGFLTQDLNHETLADTSVIDPFLAQVKKVDGVAHFLFHQIHLLRQLPVRGAIGEVARKAKEQGFEFWTSKEINHWERVRRKVKIINVYNDEKLMIDNPENIENVIVWIPISRHNATRYNPERVQEKFGIPCIKKVLNKLNAHLI
ncbi:hypothetical protein [Pseudalkalibacillus salsuginis]|uniref:hypothetical protein n=1 Tax=Pseudalkalibacillus salsuginis TaxID=2910972 RepID=UPI001F3CF3D7|nr:hypothetical protein [Pseudalkalibacillus salsuginis]MCF6409989.1 hypothetical protein [Pseudalkalibacillus salsuginis]